MSTTESSDALPPAAEVFARFLERVEAGEPADIEDLCREREDLAPRLRELHAGWRGLSAAFEELSGDDPTRDADSSAELMSRLAERHGEHYERRGEIGRGGMGIVHKVWDRDLSRSLAMKVLVARNVDGSPGFDRRSLSRFLSEAQITGQLEHPGVVPVHEIGIDAEGRLFFTMPLVRGKSLQEIVALSRGEREGWNLTRALGVITRVCETVGYAHSRGVIHRDLKPANVMVGPFGETYVMDWGLARVLSENEPLAQSGTWDAAGAASTDLQTLRQTTAESTLQSPLMTTDGDVVGTPAYMPPEQASGELDQIGPASDVYAIGAMLYQALSGRRPYEGEVGEESPAAVLKEVRARPPRALRQVAGELPAELEAICTKAMARDPSARYASTMELAGDLRAFLEVRVVRAYEAGAWAELKKWMIRNRALALAVAASAVFLVLGLALSLGLWSRADKSAANLAEQLGANRIERGRLLGAAGVLRLAEPLIWREFLHDPGDPHARWALWELYSRHPCLGGRVAGDSRIRRVLFSADGVVLTSCDDGWLRSWRADTFELLSEVPAHEGRIASADISSDRRWLVTAGTDDGVLALWKVPDLERVAAVTAHDGGVLAVRIHPSGERVVSAGRSAPGAGGRTSPIQEWSLPELDRIRGHSVDGGVGDLRYKDDGTALGVGTSDGAVLLLPEDLGPALHEWKVHRGPVTRVIFAEDGERIVTGGTDQLLQTWAIEGDGEPEVLGSSNGTVRELTLLSDGATLVSAGWYRIEFWDLATRELQRSYGLAASALALGIGSEERLLAISGDPGARLWEVEPGGGAYVLEGHTAPTTVAFAPGGRTVLTGDGAGIVRLWDARTGEMLRSFQAHEGRVAALEFSADGSLLATGGTDRNVHVWHLTAHTRIASFAGLALTTRRCFDLSPDGSRLVMATTEARVRVYGVETGECLAEANLQDDTSETLSVAFHPDGRRFALAAREKGAERWIRIYDTDARELARVALEIAPWTVGFMPDGRLAVASWSRNVEIVDVDDARLVASLEGHGGVVRAVATQPALPHLLASISDDETIALWDVPKRQRLISFDLERWTAASGGAVAVSLSPDGLTLAASKGEVAVLWDLTYYDRHIAGNLRLQLELLRDELGSIDEEALTTWGDQVLARPWPRLAFEHEAGK